MNNLTYRECCVIVLAHCRDDYARIYAKVSDETLAERAAEYGDTLEKAQRVQAAYILANLDGWTGSIARNVKKALGRISRGVK